MNTIIELAERELLSDLDNMIIKKVIIILSVFKDNAYKFKLNEIEQAKEALKVKINQHTRGVYFFEIEAEPYFRHLKTEDGILELDYEVVTKMKEHFSRDWNSLGYREAKFQMDVDRLYNVFLKLVRHYGYGEAGKINFLPLYVGITGDLYDRVMYKHLGSSGKGLSLGSLNFDVFGNVTFRVTFADTKTIYKTDNIDELPDIDETYLYEKILSCILHPLLGQ